MAAMNGNHVGTAPTPSEEQVAYMSLLRDRVAQAAVQCAAEREKVWAQMHDDAVSKLELEISALRSKLQRSQLPIPHKGGYDGIGHSHQSGSGRLPVLKADEEMAVTPVVEEGDDDRKMGKGSSVVMVNLLSATPLKVREEYMEAMQHPTHSRMQLPSRVTQVASEDQGGRLAKMTSAKTLKNVPVRPDGALHLFFEVLSLIVLFHDSIMVPLALSWDLANERPVQVIMLASLAVWTVDIVMNFMTGYCNKDGTLEMNVMKVCRHYLTTWFPMDMTIITAEWTAFILEVVAENNNAEGRSLVRLTKIVKLSRFLHMLVITRVLRMSPRFHRGIGLSATWSIIPQILKIVASIIWINHMNACVWYLIGRAGYQDEVHTDTGYNWLQQFVVDLGTTYADAGFWFQYTTSMHWSITQMTPGSMEVTPKNSYERLWNIICLLFGLILGSTLVGQLSSKMVQFNMSRRDELRRMEILRKFLTENSVDIVLSSRVQKHAQQRMLVKMRLVEEDVEDLQHLPAELRNNLRTQVYLQHFTRHPLFGVWEYSEKGLGGVVCASGCLRLKAVMPGYDIFTPEAKANSAYLLLKGDMRYFRMMSEEEVLTTPTGNRNVGMAEVDVSGPTWLAEVALWLVWKHIGTLQAESPSEVIVVDFDGLVKVVKMHPLIQEATLSWCNTFLAILASGETECEVEVNLPATNVILHLPSEHRVAFSASALGMMQAGIVNRLIGLPAMRSMSEGLEGEVNAGQCILSVQASGEFLRTVPVIALRIRRSQDSDRFLVQLAKCRLGDDAQSGWQPSLQLPGNKMRIGDNPDEAVRKVIMDNLPGMAMFAVIGKPTLTNETKESRSYGLPTQYLRRIYDILLRPEYAESTGAEGVSSVSLPSDCELSEYEVHIRRAQNGKAFLYAWVTESQFRHLQQGSEGALINSSVNLLRVPNTPLTRGMTNSNIDKSSTLRAVVHKASSTESKVKMVTVHSKDSESEHSVSHSQGTSQLSVLREFREPTDTGSPVPGTLLQSPANGERAMSASEIEHAHGVQARQVVFEVDIDTDDENDIVYRADV